MYSPSPAPNPPPAPPAASADSGRNARYAYLVGRLRNRQITMEEATELFTLQSAMLQRSEAARLALQAAAAAAPAPMMGRPAPKAVPAASGPAPALDPDYLLIGLLALGAGSGFLAALTKRLGELPPSSPPPDRPVDAPRP